MDLFLYEDVLIDFWQRKPSEEDGLLAPVKMEHWSSFYRFLKEGCNLHLNINLENVSIKDVSIINSVLPLLTSGRSKTSITCDPKSFIPFEQICFKDLIPSYRSIICFDNSVQVLNTRMSCNGLYLWNLRDYYRKWIEIRKIEKANTEGITVGKDGLIKKWSDLSFLRHPCNEILIIDNYFLKNKERALYTLKGILNNLCFIIDQIPHLILLSTIVNLFDKDTIRVYQTLLDYFDENGIKLKLTILIDYSNTMPHDRKILTNYFYFESGDSWDYFERNGRTKTRGTSLKVFPTFTYGQRYVELVRSEVDTVRKNKNTSILGTSLDSSSLLK